MSYNFTSNVRLQDDGQLAKEKVTFLKNNCLWGSILYLKVNFFCGCQHFGRTSLCFPKPRMQLLAFKYS